MLRRLARVPEPDCGRLLAAIEALENGPEAGDIRRLVGRSGYRLRVGKWRILLDIYEETNTIHVTQMGSRGGRLQMTVHEAGERIVER